MKEETGRIMGKWCLDEFRDIDLGDLRLNERFLKTAMELAGQPEVSIHQACSTPAMIKGAYRLFSNEKCDRNEILGQHRNKTLERMRGLETVLVIQDTTFFEFGRHKKTTGLGQLGTKRPDLYKGLIAHSALAVSSEGVALGLIDQIFWSRGNVKFKNIFEGKKESSKWLRLLKRTQEVIPEEVQTITIADREADITELLECCCEEKMDFVIRARDRVISGSEHRWLCEHLSNEPIAIEYEVQVAIKKNKKSSRSLGSRTAGVMVRYGQIKLRSRHPSEQIPLYAVLVQEDHPPQDAEPVRWILLTNIKTNSAQDAMQIIQWYQQRWHVENFHRVLKSGCTIEQTRLQDAEKIDRYIALMSVIAWRLYWLTHVSRKKPEESSELYFTPEEWKVLFMHTQRGKTLPTSPPSLREVVHWIGRLGGFVGSKRHPDPGVISLWRGYQRFNDMLLGIQLMRSSATYGEL